MTNYSFVQTRPEGWVEEVVANQGLTRLYFQEKDSKVIVNKRLDVIVSSSTNVLTYIILPERAMTSSLTMAKA